MSSRIVKELSDLVKEQEVPVEEGETWDAIKRSAKKFWDGDQAEADEQARQKADYANMRRRKDSAKLKEDDGLEYGNTPEEVAQSFIDMWGIEAFAMAYDSFEADDELVAKGSRFREDTLKIVADYQRQRDAEQEEARIMELAGLSESASAGASSAGGIAAVAQNMNQKPIKRMEGYGEKGQKRKK